MRQRKEMCWSADRVLSIDWSYTFSLLDLFLRESDN